MIARKETRSGVLDLLTRLRPVFISLCMVMPNQFAHAASKSKGGLPPEIQSFIKDKETHARALAKKLGVDVSSDVWSFFRTAQAGKLAATTNAFGRLKKPAGQHEGSSDDPIVGTPVWPTVIEVITGG